MSAEPLELHQLIDEIRQARAGLDRGDAKTNGRIDQIEKSVNALFKKVSRPGFSAERDDDDLARKDATQLCIIKHALVVPKNDGNTPEYVAWSYVRAR